MPKDQALTRPETIDLRLKELTQEYVRTTDEILKVSQLVDDKQVQNFVRERAKAVERVQKLRARISTVEEELEVNRAEQADLEGFLDYLKQLLKKMSNAEAAAEIVGNIDFTHCPACLTELSAQKDAHECVDCGAETNPELVLIIPRRRIERLALVA